MNLLGLVIVILYYGDFCDHIDYMNEYLNATSADKKAVENVQCAENPEKSSCKQITEQNEQEALAAEQAALAEEEAKKKAEEEWFDDYGFEDVDFNDSDEEIFRVKTDEEKA